MNVSSLGNAVPSGLDDNTLRGPAANDSTSKLRAVETTAAVAALDVSGLPTMGGALDDDGDLPLLPPTGAGGVDMEVAEALEYELREVTIPENADDLTAAFLRLQVVDDSNTAFASDQATEALTEMLQLAIVEALKFSENVRNRQNDGPDWLGPFGEALEWTVKLMVPMTLVVMPVVEATGDLTKDVLGDMGLPLDGLVDVTEFLTAAALTGGATLMIGFIDITLDSIRAFTMEVEADMETQRDLANARVDVLYEILKDMKRLERFAGTGEDDEMQSSLPLELRGEDDAAQLQRDQAKLSSGLDALVRYNEMATEAVARQEWVADRQTV